METTYYTRQNIAAAFIAGLVVGFFGLYAVNRFSAPEERPDARETAVEEVSAAAESPRAAVSLGAFDQPAGMVVRVGAFSLPENGWLVVHEDAAGVPGNILGARRYDAGSYDGGEIELLRNTEEGSRYYVMLHIDDGDKEFDLSKDVPATEDGEPIMETFKAVRIR